MGDHRNVNGAEGEGSARSSDERPRKRNKQAIACDQCQKRKSRCELITEQGCRRCVVLKTPCSLLPIDPDIVPGHSQLADPPTQIPPSQLGDSQRLQRIEEAIAELARLSKRRMSGANFEKRPVDRTTDKGKARADESTDPMPANPVSLNWTEMALEIPMHCSIARIANTCMGLTPTSGFQDPVELGIVSMMEMQCVYTKFQEDFARLLPVSDYLFGCGLEQLPEHPFLRAVILHHVAARVSRTALLSRKQCLEIYDCIQDNVTAVQTAEPSRDILRALLILSYCPNRQHEPPFAAPDPFRAALLAYDIAKDLCFDLLLARLPAMRGADMKDEWNRSLLDDACLWYAVAHRYTWANLLKSIGGATGLSSDRIITNTLSTSFVRETGSKVLEHLFAESALLEIISTLVPSFRRHVGCFATPYNSIEYEEGQFRMEAAHSRFTIWRTDHRSSSLKSMPELLTSSYYVQFCLCMKMSLVIHNLPKPLGPDFLNPLLNRTGQGLIACAADLLERVAAVKIDFDAIPHYLLNLTFLPLGLARSFDLAGMSSDHFILSQSTLQYVSKRLRAAHPSIHALLPRFDTAVSGISEETPTPSDTSFRINVANQSLWPIGAEDQPLPEFLQGMLHSDFAAWPTNLDPFGLGNMIWPSFDSLQHGMDSVDEASGLAALEGNGL